MKNSLLIIASLILLMACDSKDNANVAKSSKKNSQTTSSSAKFEPEDGKCILFVGQELEAIGGLDKWKAGYFDYFPHPGGFTMYTKIRPGDTEFGFTYMGLVGLKTTDDWGDGPSNMSLQVADEDFAHSALAIGLELVNHESEVANGQLDGLVDSLGRWIKSLGDRPVFLRIGYEFGGEWNHYNKDDYKKAYRRIKDRYDKMGIENIAYVWQSHGWGQDQSDLASWYPGDDYVDWCGVSFFARWPEIQMVQFAKKRGKPVFIAEATPTLPGPNIEIDGSTKETKLYKPEQANEAWDIWFTAFFKLIDDNPETIKAISYINCNWNTHEMWRNNPTFKSIDARLQVNPDIAKKWLLETNKEKYLKASPKLFDYLWNK